VAARPGGLSNHPETFSAVPSREPGS